MSNMKDNEWWKMFMEVMTKPDRKDLVVTASRDNTEEEEKQAKIMSELLKHNMKNNNLSTKNIDMAIDSWKLETGRRPEGLLLPISYKVE